MNSTPGENVAMISTMPSFNGSSRMLLLSITWPIELVEVSSSGVSAVTCTVSAAWPISIFTSIVMRSFTRTLIPDCTDRRKPAASTLSEYVPGIRNGIR